MTSSFLLVADAMSPSNAWAMFWTCAIAGIGGVVVFVGLVMEGHPREKPFKNIEEMRGQDAKARWGWRILMFGILMEIVVAAGVAYNESKHAREMETKIKAADPINLPVSEIRGRMVLSLKGPLDGAPQAGHIWDSWIEMNESNLDMTTPRTLNLGSFNTFHPRDVQAFETRSDGPIAHGYSFSFEGDSYVPSFTEGLTLPDQRPVTPGIVTNKITNLGCKMSFIPPESEITGGAAEITVNGTFKKKFLIPAQKSTKDAYFYATNIIN